MTKMTTKDASGDVIMKDAKPAPTKTQTRGKLIKIYLPTSVGRPRDRLDLPWIVDEANDTSETRFNMNTSSGSFQRETYAIPSWSDRIADGMLGSNRYIATPSACKSGAIKQTLGDEVEFSGYHRTQSAPLALEHERETSIPINKADNNTQAQANLFVVKEGKYVSPEYMKGVPVAKLVEGGEYWRETWPTIEEWIKGSKQPWVYDTVRYWKAHSIHPNQLISIEYLDDLGLCSAETPRTLQLTLEDLKAGQVSDPLRWLRERLGHLITEAKKDGKKNFSLKSVLKRFRAHDTEFRRYYRAGKTHTRVNDGPNDAQATSLKRARAEDSGESSTRPTKKVHSTAGDRATLTGLPRND